MQSYIFVGPVERQRKRYIDDPTVPIPKRTLIRHASKVNATRSDTVEYEYSHEVAEATVADLSNTVGMLKNVECRDVSECLNTSHMEVGICDDETFLEETQANSDACQSSDEYDTCSSTSTCSNTDISDMSDICSSDTELEDTPCVEDSNVTECELQALCIVSYILKYNLTATAGKDLLFLLQSLFPGNTNFQNMKYEHLLSKVSKNEPKVMHYCGVCNGVFPDDPDVFQCTLADCPGLRYKGTVANQKKQGRQPLCSFVIADIESQLRSLVERNNIWEDIKKTKQYVESNPEPTTINDITDGTGYREHSKPGGCLHGANKLSCIFNTDGVPLFNSSKVKLWPIFLCINELPPAQRFARENTIIAGLWQGKDKPPFFQYISAFGDVMTKLHVDGIPAQPAGSKQHIQVHLTALLASVDLQAKAYITNMTMHNGEYACITCEEKGMTVKQGKGYSRYYPYRPPGQKPPVRDSDDLKYVKGMQATGGKNRIMGICGVTGLLSLEWFDMVQGIVPDYMHGVLLGVTKNLMTKWFSPTHSGKPYFVGKHLKAIAKRLGRIQPPDYIERLPRDLEKNYSHFKATEFQTWLLFYAIPCLNGYLGVDYLEHFACLSEAVHILLRDRIPRTQLDRAETLLKEFYSDFAKLYGEGSCGLNVHNIGSHLVEYVRMWGPLFCWSCFGFEDCNADLLNSAHGTGNVIKPVLKTKGAQFRIWSMDIASCQDSSLGNFLSNMVPSCRKRWKNLKQCTNCSIAGSQKKLETQESEFILAKTCASSITDLKKVSRVKIGQQYLYSKEYSRMIKRRCNVVLCENGDMFSVEYFLLNEVSNIVYAVGFQLEIQEQCYLYPTAGHHLLKVNRLQDVCVFQVDQIQEKLFFITPEDTFVVVARVPNMHGRGLFK